MRARWDRSWLAAVPVQYGRFRGGRLRQPRKATRGRARLEFRLYSEEQQSIVHLQHAMVIFEVRFVEQPQSIGDLDDEDESQRGEVTEPAVPLSDC